MAQYRIYINERNTKEMTALSAELRNEGGIITDLGFDKSRGRAYYDVTFSESQAPRELIGERIIPLE